MKNAPKPSRPKDNMNDAPIYLIFDSITDAESPDATVQELDEISQIGKMILESTEEAPLFLTCT